MNGHCINCSNKIDNCKTTLCPICNRYTVVPNNYPIEKHYFFVIYNNEFYRVQSELPIKLKLPHKEISWDLFKRVDDKIKGFWDPCNKDSNGDHPDIYEIINENLFK